MKKLLMFLAFAWPMIPAVWMTLSLMNLFEPRVYPHSDYGMHPLKAIGGGFYTYFVVISGQILVLILVQTIRSFWRDERDRKSSI